jgi:hypothetical protein
MASAQATQVFVTDYNNLYILTAPMINGGDAALQAGDTYPLQSNTSTGTWTVQALPAALKSAIPCGLSFDQTTGTLWTNTETGQIWNIQPLVLGSTWIQKL